MMMMVIIIVSTMYYKDDYWLRWSSRYCHRPITSINSHIRRTKRVDCNISSDNKQNQSLSISYCHFELVDRPTQLIFPWIFICFHVFHDKAKRTQQGNLLILNKTMRRHCLFCIYLCIVAQFWPLIRWSLASFEEKLPMSSRCCSLSRSSSLTFSRHCFEVCIL